MSIILLLFGVCTGVTMAQNIQITGQVTDGESGEPLMGVTVVLKSNPQKGAYTDLDGKYTISADAQDILVFSFVGMESQEVPVQGRSVINLTMYPDSKILGEVVVTALGIKRNEKSLPYATQKIGGKELTKVPSSNLLGNLAGKTAGMTVSGTGAGVGSSVKVVLRGNRSIFGNNQPLYVVDGTPINSKSFTDGANADGGFGGRIDAGDGLAGINPEDIEDINVLKGASAAALYGAQAANGVIMITTKRGAQDRIAVNYNTSFQADIPYMTYKFQDQYAMGTEGKAVKSNWQWGPKGDPAQLSNSFIPEFFNTGKLFINSVSVSGGSKKMRNYFSYQNTTGAGIMPLNKYAKHNLALRSTTNLFDDFLEVDASIAVMKQDIDHAPSAPSRYFNPIVGLYLFPEGANEFAQYKDQYEVFAPNKNIMKQNWAHEEDINKNPYWLTNRYNFDFHVQKAINKVNLTFNLTDWLKLKLRGSYDYTRMDSKRKVNWGVTVITGDQGGRYEVNKDEIKDLYADALLTANKSFGDFNLNGTLGTSISDYQVTRLGNRVNLRIPNLFHLNNFIGRPINSEEYEHRQLQSVFGTLSVGWRDMLYVDATARNDWSSTLPHGNRSYFYPSIGTSFIFTELLKQTDNCPSFLSFGKFRISWTQVGNDMPWGKTIVYDALNEAGDIAKNTIAPFEDLKPEKSSAFETGLNLRLFDNRLLFDIAYYKTNTENQYFLVDAPSGTGFSKYYINAGEIQNRGIELTLGYEMVRSKDFNWTTTLNYTTNKNTIISLPEQYKETGLKLTGGGYTYLLKEGEEWGEMYMKRAKRDEQGRVIVKEEVKDGVVKQQLQDSKEEERVGNVSPKFMLGWNNEFNFRNFNLSFQIDGRFGGSVISSTQAFLNRYGRSEESAEARNAGGIKVPAVDIEGNAYNKPIDAQVWYTSKEGEFAIYDATNIRLRELSLGYQLPQSLIAKAKYIKGARFSIIGRNLLYLYREAPFDPEMVLSSTTNSTSNIDNFSIPMSRTIGVSLNINF